MSPIRDVAVLAERLKRLCRDNIEPSIYGLDVQAIPADEAGSGVVVLRIGESPYAPHIGTVSSHRACSRSSFRQMRTGMSVKCGLRA